MSEEVKIKISQPMFEVGELERFDNNIHSIVEEYSKMFFKEKDQILTQRIIMKQEEEIKQLQDQLQQKDNITKEVREILNNKREILTMQLLDGGYCDYEELLYQVYEEIRKILDKVEENKNGSNII